MYFYEVLVAAANLAGTSRLTYASNERIPLRTVVEVPLRSTSVMGYISKQSERPKDIRIRHISSVYANYVVPPELHRLQAWMEVYYPAATASHTQLFLPQSIQPPAAEEHPAHITPANNLPPLTSDQHKALETIHALGTPSPVLLFGVTGSGKTRVYIELAREAILKGKSVIILTPEIGLAPQLVEQFSESFPDRVVKWHSRLSRKQRDSSWARICNTQEPVIVIGPRSALFTPVSDLGLVVLDECHDNAYKQDQPPHYDATRVAAKLASLHGSLCVYGTATPSVTDYYSFMARKIPVIRLERPARTGTLRPKMITIDIKKRDDFTKSSLFSDFTVAQIEQSISKNTQVLVFLNRRGSARVVMCTHCGWQALCPRCDMPLTYHGDTHDMKCHTCGYTSKPFTLCPECNHNDIVYKSHGTKSIASELSRLFPQAKIKRFDSDNSISEKLDAHYHDLKEGSVDIIVGTQIVAKGLDLPKLRLVVLPIADTGNSLPDYTADEQNFQLLTQVIGRVGRTSAKSTVILQTYTPNSPLLSSVVKGTWDAFYADQITSRKAFKLPPFRYVLQLTCVRKSQASAHKAAKNLRDVLNEKHKSTIEILGPAPRFHERVNNQYHWQLIVSSKSREQLLGVIHSLPANWRFNIDPVNFL